MEACLHMGIRDKNMRLPKRSFSVEIGAHINGTGGAAFTKEGYR